MRQTQITNWCHDIIELYATKGGQYIDATMGNGNDTLFLCHLAEETGHVMAFDIQEKALATTKALLKKHCLNHRAELKCECHTQMDQYWEDNTADIICFNFGYLPGGDHTLATCPDTSRIAVEKGLRILKSGGVMSLCIYSGGDTGFAEKECLLPYLETLPPRDYTVIYNAYYNKPSNPPIPVFIFKK